MVRAAAFQGRARHMLEQRRCGESIAMIQHEYPYRHTFAHVTELVAAVDNWMNFYSTCRRDSTLGMLNSANYEQFLTAPFVAA